MHPNAVATTNLYVANAGNNTVAVYTPDWNNGTMAKTRTVYKNVNGPRSIAFDTLGDLYVANNTNITEYSETSATPNTVIATISTGVSNPKVIAIDSNNNLYVGNAGNNTVSKYAQLGGGTVSSTPTWTASAGVSSPIAIAFQGNGYITVAEAGNNTVTNYAMSTGANGRTISTGISNPQALAFDSAGNLYVANYGNSTVTDYAPYAITPQFTITSNITQPNALVIDANGVLWVGNHGTGTNAPTSYYLPTTPWPRGPTSQPTYHSTYDNYAVDGSNMLIANDGTGTLDTLSNGYVTALNLSQVDIKPWPSSVFCPSSDGLSSPTALAAGP